MRSLSKVAPGWWDYTTLHDDLLSDAARLTAEDLLQLSRPGFTVKISGFPVCQDQKTMRLPSWLQRADRSSRGEETKSVFSLPSMFMVDRSKLPLMVYSPPRQVTQEIRVPSALQRGTKLPQVLGVRCLPSRVSGFRVQISKFLV